jgi:hypothetical protein
MRIAHLTLLHGYNYGGMLQAYATQKILKSYGHEVLTLDYHPGKKVILLRKLSFNIAALHKSIQYLLDIRQFSGVSQFNDFRSHNFNFSAPCYNERQISSVCQEIDAVVVGSDQVWSPSWVRPPYFLDFDLDSKCKRLALSACCGQPSGDPQYLEYCTKTISKFDAISVRNNFTAELVQKTTGREAEVVCDPTLATDLPTEEVNGITGSYIIVYVLNRKKSVMLANEVIRHLKSTTGLPVYSITPAELKGVESLEEVDKAIYGISPFQWSHLIENAAYVVTDSFHGTMFAVKSHRNLMVLDSGFKSAGRFRTFLNAVGLEHMLIADANALLQIKTPPESHNWTAIDAKIAKMSETYHRFVYSSLND